MSCLLICVVVVGLMYLKGLVFGVESGKLSFESNCCVMGWAGMCIVISVDLVVIILGICFDFFRSSVKGLGIKVVVSMAVVLGIVFI